MKSFLLRFLGSAAFLVVIYFVVSRNLKWTDITHAFHLLSWSSIAIAILFSLAISVLKAVRFYFLNQRSGIRISLLRTMRLFLASQAASPLPAGEAMRGALLMHETDAKSVEASGPVIAQAFLEVAAAVLLVVIGSYYYPTFRWYAVILTVVVCVLFVFALHPELLKKILHTKLKAVAHAQEEVRRILLPKKRVDRFFFAMVGLALLTDVIGGVLIYFLATRLQLPIGLFGSVFLFAVSIAIQGILPIIPGGLGVTEGGMLGVLDAWGIALAPALSLVVIYRMAMLLFPVLLGLAFLVVFYSKRLVKL